MEDFVKIFYSENSAAATFYNKAWRAYGTESRVALPSGNFQTSETDFFLFFREHHDFKQFLAASGPQARIILKNGPLE